MNEFLNSVLEISYTSCLNLGKSLLKIQLREDHYKYGLFNLNDCYGGPGRS